jgi:hypothetical protein
VSDLIRRLFPSLADATVDRLNSTAYSAFIKGGKLMDVVMALSPSLGGGRGGFGGGGRGGYGGGRGGYMGGNGGHNIQPDWRVPCFACYALSRRTR